MLLPIFCPDGAVGIGNGGVGWYLNSDRVQNPVRVTKIA